MSYEYGQNLLPLDLLELVLPNYPYCSITGVKTSDGLTFNPGELGIFIGNPDAYHSIPCLVLYDRPDYSGSREFITDSTPSNTNFTIEDIRRLQSQIINGIKVSSAKELFKNTDFRDIPPSISYIEKPIKNGGQHFGKASVTYKCDDSAVNNVTLVIYDTNSPAKAIGEIKLEKIKLGVYGCIIEGSAVRERGFNYGFKTDALDHIEQFNGIVMMDPYGIEVNQGAATRGIPLTTFVSLNEYSEIPTINNTNRHTSLIKGSDVTVALKLSPFGTLNFSRAELDGYIPATVTSLIPLLDYFQSLGINQIELMPVSMHTPGTAWNYGHPCFTLDPDIASFEMIAALKIEANKRRIEIIADFVGGHTTTPLNPHHMMGANAIFDIIDGVWQSHLTGCGNTINQGFVASDLLKHHLKLLSRVCDGIRFDQIAVYCATITGDLDHNSEFLNEILGVCRDAGIKIIGEPTTANRTYHYGLPGDVTPIEFRLRTTMEHFYLQHHNPVRNHGGEVGSMPDLAKGAPSIFQPDQEISLRGCSVHDGLQPYDIGIIGALRNIRNLNLDKLPKFGDLDLASIVDAEGNIHINEKIIEKVHQAIHKNLYPDLNQMLRDPKYKELYLQKNLGNPQNQLEAIHEYALKVATAMVASYIIIPGNQATLNSAAFRGYNGDHDPYQDYSSVSLDFFNGNSIYGELNAFNSTGNLIRTLNECKFGLRKTPQLDAVFYNFHGNVVQSTDNNWRILDDKGFIGTMYPKLTSKSGEIADKVYIVQTNGQYQDDIILPALNDSEKYQFMHDSSKLDPNNNGSENLIEKDGKWIYIGVTDPSVLVFKITT
jgi:hypothetical protein